MKSITLLGLLLAAAASLFFLVHSPEPKVQDDPWDTWDMRQEIQDASDIERNPWKRGM